MEHYTMQPGQDDALLEAIVALAREDAPAASEGSSS